MTQARRIFPWLIVFLVSSALLAGLISLWYNHECCALNKVTPLQSDDQVLQALVDGGSTGLFRMPTGIYVQSLSFDSANDVQITGRIWQRLPPGQTLPEGAEMGVLFPDAISNHSDNLTEIYKDYLLPSGARLYVWNFQVVLRQRFDFSDYPLDGKLVWIRFWTVDVENKLQLVPDLGAYANRDISSDMGISETLVSGEWSVQNSFFGYDRLSYDTDFGRDTGNVIEGKLVRPELRFYVVLKRNFIDAFLINLVPLFVTLGLLFGLVMTVSRDPDQADRLGFNTMAVFGSCAGLFFIVVLGHIQVRQEFAGSQMVYIEYFYVASYLVLLAVSVFSFMITYSEDSSSKWILRNNGQYVKLGYWPVLLGGLLTMSVYLLE